MMIPSFVNTSIGERNFKDLNQDQDLYLKNMRNKGLDKESEQAEEADDENPKPKKAYTQRNINYKYNNRNYDNNYQEEQTGNNEDDAFKSVTNGEHREYNPKPTYKTSYRGSNREDDIWNSIVKPEEEEQKPREKKERNYEYEKYENNWNNQSEIAYQGEEEQKPREKKERKYEYEKYDNNWNNQGEIAYQEKKEEKPQPTKVEFKMKGSGLADLFKRKEKK